MGLMMYKSQTEMIKRLESMPLDQARLEIATGKYGDIGSPNHLVASSWLEAKQASIRDEREEETLSISRRALSISASARKWAIIAIIITTVTTIATIIIQMSFIGD